VLSAEEDFSRFINDLQAVLGVSRYSALVTQHCIPHPNTKGGDCMKEQRKEVIAYRKSCAANGTGLSHYILMDKKTK
jgi:modified peptide precursor CbpA